MASLTALNTASDDTLTATDLRNATLIFSYPAAFDIEMTESLGQAQIAFQYPFDVIEMIRPDLLNLEITITVPITPTILITATGLPSGVTLSGPSGALANIYTVTGIDSVDDWDLTVDALEVTIPTGYTGSFEYDVALNYFQVPDGNTSQTYTVGVARPDALLSSAFGITIPGAARLTTETNYSSQFTFAESGTYIRGPYQLQFANNFAITPTGLRIRLLNIPTVGAVAQMQTTGTWAIVASGVRNRVLPTQFSQSALGNFIADFASTMAANTTQVVETGFTRFFDATTYSALATKVTATLTSKTADFGATLSSQFGMTVTPLELPGIYETQPSVFGLDAQARFDWRSFTKTFNPAFGSSTIPNVTRDHVVNLPAVNSLSVPKIDNYPFDYTDDVTIPIDSAVATGGYGFGKRLRLVNNTLFVGTGSDSYADRDDGDGIYIYDVSDPENVSYVGKLNPSVTGLLPNTQGNAEIGGMFFDVIGNTINVFGTLTINQNQNDIVLQYTYNTTTVPAITGGSLDGDLCSYVYGTTFGSVGSTNIDATAFVANSSYMAVKDGAYDQVYVNDWSGNEQYQIGPITNTDMGNVVHTNGTNFLVYLSGRIDGSYVQDDEIRVYTLGTSSSYTSISPPGTDTQLIPHSMRGSEVLCYSFVEDKVTIMSTGGSLIKQIDWPSGWFPAGFNDDYFVFYKTPNATRIKLINRNGTPGGTFDLTPQAENALGGQIHINADSTALVYTDFEFDTAAPYDQTESDVYIMKNVEP